VSGRLLYATITRCQPEVWVVSVSQESTPLTLTPRGPSQAVLKIQLAQPSPVITSHHRPCQKQLAAGLPAFAPDVLADGRRPYQCTLRSPSLHPGMLRPVLAVKTRPGGSGALPRLAAPLDEASIAYNSGNPRRFVVLAVAIAVLARCQNSRRSLPPREHALSFCDCAENDCFLSALHLLGAERHHPLDLVAGPIPPCGRDPATASTSFPCLHLADGRREMSSAQVLCVPCGSDISPAT